MHGLNQSCRIQGTAQWSACPTLFAIILFCLSSVMDNALASYRCDPSSIPVIDRDCTYTWQGMVAGRLGFLRVIRVQLEFLPILYTEWTVRRYQHFIRSSGWTASSFFLSSSTVGVSFCNTFCSMTDVNCFMFHLEDKIKTQSVTNKWL